MDPKKSYIGIRNAADSTALELFFTDYIYDGIDWSTFEMSNMVQDTIDKVKAANPSKIILTINSLGGDVMIGLAIYNFLKDYNAKVEVKVIGFAGSIASIIAMCANKGKLSMASTSFMIIHAASTFAAGNAKDMRDQADVLDKVTNEMAEIYAMRSGKTAADFTAMWADGGDVWLTAKEAQELGLCDELINTAPVTARVDIAEYGYKNIPAALITNNIKPINMAFEKLLTLANSQSFEVVDGGFLLEEDHLNALTAAVVKFEEAEQTVITNAVEITRLNNELLAANEARTGLDAKLVEKETEITTLSAKVVELGAEPSGAGTAITAIVDEPVDKNNVPFHASTNNPANAWADKHLSKQKNK